MDEALIKQLKQRVEEELRQRESALLEFWLQELKNLDAKRHKELAALQSDLRSFIGRMETRLRTLKTGLDR
jgi:predicted component of type VI protein secretion system